ncbi:MAG: outer membrane beta-barrel protein [Bacteroidales bacterium]|nr:outer membrane beta-barrel protein [Bacteroidales bacterium]
MLMMTAAAHAQASVQLGILLNTLKTENAAGRLSGSYKGLLAAADYNFSLTEYLAVAPGLGIGYSFNNEAGFKYKELGLFAPLDFNYRLPMSGHVSLSFFAGPTLYYGLLSQETSINPPYNYYAQDNRRFDVFLGGGVWTDINKTIRVKVSYKFGLTNTSKINGITEKSNCLSIAVGYLF